MRDVFQPVFRGAVVKCPRRTILRKTHFAALTHGHEPIAIVDDVLHVHEVHALGQAPGAAVLRECHRPEPADRHACPLAKRSAEQPLPGTDVARLDPVRFARSAAHQRAAVSSHEKPAASERRKRKVAGVRQRVRRPTVDRVVAALDRDVHGRGRRAAQPVHRGAGHLKRRACPEEIRVRDGFAVGRFAAVAKFPDVKQLVTVAVTPPSRERERLADRHRVGWIGDLNARRPVSIRRPEDHAQVHPERLAIAALRHRRHRDTAAAIVKRLTNLQRVVAWLFAVHLHARGRRHVQQQRTVAAHPVAGLQAPAQHDLVVDRPLPHRHPVVASGVFANLERAHAVARLAVIVCLDAVRAST